MNLVLGYIASSFWLMRQPEFDAMLSIVARDSDAVEKLILEAERSRPEAMLAKSGNRLDGTRYVTIRDGVAVVDVNGRLAKRMDFFTEICEGGTSTEILLKDIQTAIDNPNVSSIVFNIDSPGGEAFGINEIANHIFASRGKKPIKAYVSGLGCSGAYWIASACDEIICDKSAFLGSIGVVSVWIDDTEAYKMLGFDKKVVVSSNAPKKRLDLNKAEDMAEFKAELDAMERVFLQSVARNRKKKMDEVINDFNQGGVLGGADSVKAGMADRTGSLEEVIKELQKTKKTGTATAGTEGDMNMSFSEKWEKFLTDNGWRKPTSESQPTTIEASAPPAESNATVETERKRADEATAELARIKTEQIVSDADAFIDAECKAGRMFPAEKETFKTLFVQAAADDLSAPVAEGSVSRVDALKANQAKRIALSFTSEIVDAEANEHFILKVEDSKSKLDQDVETQVDNYVATVTPNRKLEIVK